MPDLPEFPSGYAWLAVSIFPIHIRQCFALALYLTEASAKQCHLKISQCFFTQGPTLTHAMLFINTK